MIHRVCAMVGVVLVLAGRVLADPSTPPAEPVNSCHDVHSWREWDTLVARHPDDQALQALHALRLGLCTKVDRGDLTVAQATILFETARQALLTQLRDQQQPGKRRTDL
jgi:hypothetical protein